MTVHGRCNTNPAESSSRRRLLAVVAVSVGIAAVSGPGVAWAAPEHSDDSASAGTSSSESSADAGSGPSKPVDGKGPHRTASPKAPKHLPSDTDATASGDTSRATTTPPKTSHPKRVGTTTADPSPDGATKDPSASPTARKVASTKVIRAGSTPKPEAAVVAPTSSETAALTVKAAAVTTATTPSPPGPLSPIAKLIALPGRIVNTLLQALDLTVSVGGPKSPFNFAPIDEMLFAAFRGVESALGLRKTPAVAPVVATETYTGPTTAVTPTVAQFLNAAAAEYVLGGVPGGLVPFTVNGVQLTSTNLLSGESAQAWVTPQKQIIIAYQGTTGGTNLLFNPLIAISQIVTDAQIIFTNSTPLAFTDSLAFEQRVQAQATLQGYGTDDLFVTGHSLGGWEAEYVAQQTGLGGIGFESPGINTVVPGNGADSGFVNVETYGDTAAYLATDLPALQPFIPAYVPGGGIKPHFGSIVMIGDPTATDPLINASSLVGPNLIGDAIFAVDILGNFFEHHLPGMQAYNLDVSPDPGVVPWLGATMGPIEAGWGELTVSQLLLAASQAGTLITP
jgi:hypothetical protein